MASNIITYLKAFGVSVAIMGTGWLLMETTTPSKETMMKRLPKDQTNPQRMSQVDKTNAELFRVLADNTKLDKPVWQVKGRTDLNEILSKK